MRSDFSLNNDSKYTRLSTRYCMCWSRRGTKVSGLDHVDNPLIKPTGMRIATKVLASSNHPRISETHQRQDNVFGNELLFFLFFSLISLIADGPHHYHPACGHKGSCHLSPVYALQFFIAMQVQHSYNSSTRFTPYNFLSRCKFSTLTTRQPMVEFYLLTFPRFPLRKKEHKSYFGMNRTHDFRTSRCAGYLLDHSGVQLLLLESIHAVSRATPNDY